MRSIHTASANEKQISCHACGANQNALALNLGDQPVSNRFVRNPNEEQFWAELEVVQCPRCALIQISKPFPISELRPRFEWITYREPEAHLDRTAAKISSLPGISEKSVVLGVSYKEDTTLKRLQNLGVKKAWRLDPVEHLGFKGGACGMETIQELMTPVTARRLASKFGQADVVIARHILEHCYNPKSFLESLQYLLKPNGYLVLEVPGCEKALDQHSYCILWEEHLFYFTEATYKRFLAKMGLEILEFSNVEYPFENSLVAICQNNRKTVSDETVLDKELQRFRSFCNAFEATGQRFEKFFASISAQGKQGALFGAGHLSCAFLTFHRLSRFFAFVVDDNPNKKGCLMPGSLLPIKGSSALLEERPALCVLAVNPDIEEKIVEQQRAYVNGGGRFASIFPSSPFFPKI